jgi:hypothetical protein
MSTLGFAGNKKPTKVLIVDSLDNQNLILSARNVQKTKVTNGFGLNIYDLIYHEKLLISKSAVEELSHLLDPKRENGEDAAAPEAEVKAQEKPKAKKEAKPKKEKAEKAKQAAAEEVETGSAEEATDNE